MLIKDKIGPHVSITCSLVVVKKKNHLLYICLKCKTCFVLPICILSVSGCCILEHSGGAGKFVPDLACICQVETKLLWIFHPATSCGATGVLM